MKPQRQDARGLCADLVKLRWLDTDGNPRKEVAGLLDISHGGLCLRLDDPILPETEITILYPSGKYRGRVRYCLLERLGYRIGVDFEQGYRWSPRLHQPAHLSLVHCETESEGVW